MTGFYDGCYVEEIYMLAEQLKLTDSYFSPVTISMPQSNLVSRYWYRSRSMYGIFSTRMGNKNIETKIVTQAYICRL